ncbi:MAG: 4'-phosphopantetheinyl transferase superfamily protein [Candidatus Eisenbacteria bacterium]|nr:4'-phosphopantetheinyl transferase superfamily protein [Candidatus Eisenbacteria bacterium]
MSTTDTADTTALTVVRLNTIALPSSLSGEALAALSSEERARAERMRAGGAEWAHARAALRRVLASECGVAPERIAFDHGTRGKPALAAGLEGALEFSASRSGSVAMIVTARGRAVGVDVERVRAGLSEDELAEHYFDDAARAELATLRSEHPERAFFRAWVRFEARAKATGIGIVVESEGAATFCRECDAPTGFVAAIAAAGTAPFTIEVHS